MMEAAIHCPDRSLREFGRVDGGRGDRWTGGQLMVHAAVQNKTSAQKTSKTLKP